MSLQPAFHIPGAAKGDYDPTCKALVVVWEKLVQVKEVVDRVNSEGKRLGARTLIVEVPAGLVMRQEDATLFQEYVPKQQLAAGVVNLINIVSTSAVTNMSSKRWKEPSKLGGLTVFEAASIPEALQIAGEHAR